MCKKKMMIMIVIMLLLLLMMMMTINTHVFSARGRPSRPVLSHFGPRPVSIPGTRRSGAGHSTTCTARGRCPGRRRGRRQGRLCADDDLEFCVWMIM